MGSEVLDQATRRRIYEHIEAHPGTHMRELQRQLGISGGTLEYHLHVMVRAGLLSTRRSPRYLRFYVASQVGRREKDVLGLLRQEVPRRVCALLLMEPDQSHGELLQHFQVAPSTLSFHLKKLGEHGLVEARREGRETRFRLLEADLVARCLVEFRESFTDEVVDRFADVWLNLGAGLESLDGEADEDAAAPPPGDQAGQPQGGAARVLRTFPNGDHPGDPPGANGHGTPPQEEPVRLGRPRDERA